MSAALAPRRAEATLLLAISPRISAVRTGLALDQRQRVAQSGDGLGVDRIRLEVRAEPLEDVGDEPEEHARVGLEELRLVVVTNERQSTLEDAPLLDVGDLRREVVALDPVGVIEEVEG